MRTAGLARFLIFTKEHAAPVFDGHRAAQRLLELRRRVSAQPTAVAFSDELGRAHESHVITTRGAGGFEFMIGPLSVPYGTSQLPARRRRAPKLRGRCGETFSRSPRTAPTSRHHPAHCRLALPLLWPERDRPARRTPQAARFREEAIVLRPSLP